MSNKVYEKFKYNYNKDITELLISRKWWGKAFWISILFGGLLLILAGFLNIWWLVSLFWITLFIIIPTLSTIWMVTYSHIKSKELTLEHIKSQINKAVQREKARDYNEAIVIWEKLKVIEEAARVRKLQSEMGSVKVAQKVVHGDDITKTEIKDSVLNRSNVGAGGDDKFAKLKELKEMFDSGFISKEEMEDMKKDILGK